MSKYCHKCGHEMGPGDVYCPSCKAKSSDELTPERIAEIQANYKTDKKGCFKFGGLLFLLALVILTSWILGGEDGMGATVLIMVFAVANIVLFKMNKSKKNQKVKTNYYKLSLKEDLSNVDEKCPQCHSLVDDDQPFCTNCGTKLGKSPSNKNNELNEKQTQTVICKTCHEVLPANAKFCSGCGAKTAEEPTCISCGELLQPDHLFCGSCGTKIDKKEGLA